jgi:hypothetical protein
MAGFNDPKLRLRFAYAARSNFKPFGEALNSRILVSTDEVHYNDTYIKESST